MPKGADINHLNVGKRNGKIMSIQMEYYQPLKIYGMYGNKKNLRQSIEQRAKIP